MVRGSGKAFEVESGDGGVRERRGAVCLDSLISPTERCQQHPRLNRHLMIYAYTEDNPRVCVCACSIFASRGAP